MAEQGKINGLPRLPRRSLVYILICSAGIISFLLFGIYPNQQSLKTLEKERKEYEYRMREQEILSPVFQKFIQVLSKNGSHKPPEKRYLAQSELAAIPFRLKNLAQRNGLEYREVVPDVNTLKNKGKRLLLTLYLAGDFIKFRSFLIQLGSLSYLSNLERIEINSGTGIKKYKIRLWFYMKPTG